MAHRLRLVLALVLATLTIMLFVAPSNAVAAAPSCGAQTGHFSGCNDRYGYQDTWCGEPTYCRIGWQCFQWDCVRDGGGNIVVQNVIAESPYYCTCQGGTIHFKCC